MQPPIPVGTVLQNRYRVLNVLGQGGFGRTYLAEDQGRFNELCALKELIPLQEGSYALEKSKELFQREATILYQIQHPQIPQFRATFEQDQRLFLVQDYVEGRTYQELLDERRMQGYAFSEPEVLQLMRQLLPVLAHIHAKGIVHRDIAPDNIILRERDRLPVLIDFGVVKELATRFQSESRIQPTTVGKQGYAPSEQIQAGKAYPSSDLYSLAVTIAVLLTGQEPAALFDDNTMTWYWQRWVTVSPNLTQVLNQMLKHRPGDRYQSVSEVMQALQGVGSQVVPPGTPPTPVSPQQPNPTRLSQPQPDVSRMQTMAVSRAPESTQYTPGNSRRPDPVVPPSSTRSSLWDDPWAVGMVAIGLMLLTGVCSWAAFTLIRNNQQVQPTPTETVSPSPTVSETPSPSPTASAVEPIVTTRRLDVGPNTNITIPGNLRTNETVNYILSARQGQQLSASLSGEGVLLTILAPDSVPVDANAKRRQQWQGKLPLDGSYTIQLSPVKGAANQSYKLDIALTNPAPSPKPISIQRETIAPEEFQQGTVTRQGNVGPTIIWRYLVNLQEGQSLQAKLFPESGATLTFRFPESAGGQPIPDVSGSQGSIVAAYNGRYQIEITAPQETGFTLEITSKPPEEVPPSPSPTPAN
ncbi:MAG: protein kinase [Scytolyngbya sp. HA4215-MV1]|nr:protein kinase [Scytolyngbya sp. HA4215-MV1]